MATSRPIFLVLYFGVKKLVRSLRMIQLGGPAGTAGCSSSWRALEAVRSFIIYVLHRVEKGMALTWIPNRKILKVIKKKIR